MTTEPDYLPEEHHCASIDGWLGFGSTGRICGTGIRACSFCGLVSAWLCDFIIGPGGQTCDADLCERHRIVQFEAETSPLSVHRSGEPIDIDVERRLDMRLAKRLRRSGDLEMAEALERTARGIPEPESIDFCPTHDLMARMQTPTPQHPEHRAAGEEGR